MAEATAEAHTVAVDIEVLENCLSQLIPISSPTTSEDDQVEIAFRREDLNPMWVSSMKERTRLKPGLLKLSSASKSCSIHRFPNWLRQQNSTGYEPKVISIGPLHYAKRGELQAMEEHKWAFLHGIVSRKHEDEGWLEHCLGTVKTLEKKARNCYSEEIELKSDSFVEMMVLDACFILELFRRFWLNDYNDFIFQFPFLIEALRFDLLLLENQIPFFILEKLYLLIDDASSISLPDSALHFLLRYNMTAENSVSVSNRKIRHLLHLLHACYAASVETRTKRYMPYASPRIPRASEMIRHLLHLLHACYAASVETRTKRYMPYTSRRIPRASELEKVGIKFRKRYVSESEFLDIRFDNGIIEIPNTPILGNTMQIDRQLLNLVAFEQCYPHCRKYITAYAIFMNYLINSGKDVKILSRKGIIYDGRGNVELVPRHFDNMTERVMMNFEDFYLSDVCAKNNEYSKRTTPKLRASFKSYLRGYFKNPWAIISFSAAVLLLLLTVTQTFFTAFPKFAYGN